MRDRYTSFADDAQYIQTQAELNASVRITPSRVLLLGYIHNLAPG